MYTYMYTYKYVNMLHVPVPDAAPAATPARRESRGAATPREKIVKHNTCYY